MYLHRSNSYTWQPQRMWAVRFPLQRFTKLWMWGGKEGPGSFSSRLAWWKRRWPSFGFLHWVLCGFAFWVLSILHALCSTYCLRHYWSNSLCRTLSVRGSYHFLTGVYCWSIELRKGSELVHTATDIIKRTGHFKAVSRAGSVCDPQWTSGGGSSADGDVQLGSLWGTSCGAGTGHQSIMF